MSAELGKTRALQTFLSWQEATLEHTLTTGNSPCPASQQQGTELCLEDIIQASQTRMGEISLKQCSVLPGSFFAESTWLLAASTLPCCRLTKRFCIYQSSRACIQNDAGGTRRVLLQKETNLINASKVSNN